MTADPSEDRATPVPAGLADWAVLLVLSGLLSVVLVLLHVPAGVLLGAMLAGIAFGVAGREMTVPHVPYRLAQGLAGVLIAGSLSPSMLAQVVAWWPLLILFTVLTLVAAFAVGWGVHRWAGVPSEPAILGSLPGMSGAMVIIARERGIDQRIVALMQYVRLAMVIVTLIVVGRFVPITTPLSGPVSEVLVTGHGAWLVILAVALLALPAARLKALPAAAMLVPMIVGSLLELGGWAHLALPAPLTAFVFLIVGLDVGLRFTRPVLSRVVGLIPAVLLSSLVLLLLSGGLALLAQAIMDLDPMTAFLATAPGSIETVAIVAAASHVDVNFVLAFQAVRLMTVVLLGPFIIRQVARLPIWRDRPGLDAGVQPNAENKQQE